jgi:hypothetical protein
MRGGWRSKVDRNSEERRRCGGAPIYSPIRGARLSASEPGSPGLAAAIIRVAMSSRSTSGSVLSRVSIRAEPRRQGPQSRQRQHGGADYRWSHSPRLNGARGRTARQPQGRRTRRAACWPAPASASVGVAAAPLSVEAFFETDASGDALRNACW